MARPAILKKKSAETNQRDGFSMADTFNLLGRATKIVAVGCVLGAVFGLVAAPTATVTAVGAATLWVAGYAEQALGNYIRQEDNAARDERLNKPVQQPSMLKALRSALTII